MPKRSLSFLQFRLVAQPRFMLGAHVADFAHDAGDIGNPGNRWNVAGERDLLMESCALVVRPYFLAELRRRQRRSETAEISGEVVGIPLQHARGVVVARGVDSLRQI